MISWIEVLTRSVHFWTLGLLLISNWCTAQNELSFTDFIRDVQVHHPMSKVADLQLLAGDAALLTARGGFDPKLGFGLSKKDFKEQTYYQLLGSEVKVPTNFGVEIGASYEQNNGVFLNEQNTLPEEGLWSLSVTVPLGQGLFIDKRRAELGKAKIYQEATEEKRTLLLNKLVLSAGKAYWSWFEAYHNLAVYQEAVALSRARFVAVRESSLQGDLASIDTVEAKIQLQSRELALQEATLKYQNGRNDLAVYLWLGGEQPLVLGDDVVPTAYAAMISPSIAPEETNVDTLIGSHPLLNVLQFELDKLGVDRRLRREMLKPTLDLQYKPLASTLSGLSDVGRGDYALGLHFSIPMFLRKERGALALTEVQLKEAQLHLSQQQNELRYDAINWQNHMMITSTQIQRANAIVENYQELVLGEQQLFENGESSLFLINSRESSLVSAQLKAIELIKKNKVAELAFDFSTGILNNKYILQ